MAGSWRGKLKRKDLEEVSDEFSDFSLLSPARKSRRLDAELLSIMEQGEATSTMAFDQQLPQGNISAGVSVLPSLGSAASKDPPAYPSNNERAIVLYKPVETPITLSPGPTNVSLNISWLHGFKNCVFKQGNRRFDGKDEDTEVNSGSLAVVPWVPPRSSISTSESRGFELPRQSLQESMEAEEAEVASMEVEEMTEQATANVVGGEGFQQWPQHCMSPQLLPNTATPIMWSW